MPMTKPMAVSTCSGVGLGLGLGLRVGVRLGLEEDGAHLVRVRVRVSG